MYNIELEKNLQNATQDKILSDLKNERKNVLSELNQNSDGVYIFGAGRLSKFAIEQFRKNDIGIIACLDNNASIWNTDFHGIKIINPIDADSTKVAVICTKYWSEMKIQLKKLGFTKIIGYEELSVVDDRFSFYSDLVFLDLHKVLVENKEKFIKLENEFADEKSKKIYELILQFRLSLNVDYVQEAYDISNKDGITYFDDNIMKFKDPKKIGTFVDAGGNLGETTIDFINWANADYEKVLFFEPDGNVFESAKENLREYKNINLFKAGLGAKHEKLNFSETGGEVGSFILGKGVEIDVYALDEFTFDASKINIIKADVEGFEMNILLGASNMIKTIKPVIAISAYHKAEDLFEIIEYIKKITNDYNIYLRHYMTTFADTVLYFVPKFLDTLCK